jgi:hypothetical protein
VSKKSSAKRRKSFLISFGQFAPHEMGVSMVVLVELASKEKGKNSHKI